MKINENIKIPRFQVQNDSKTPIFMIVFGKKVLLKAIFETKSSLKLQFPRSQIIVC